MKDYKLKLRNFVVYYESIKREVKRSLEDLYMSVGTMKD